MDGLVVASGFTVFMTIEVAIFSADSEQWSGILGLCPQNEQHGVKYDFKSRDAVEEQRVLQRNTVPYQIKERNYKYEY